MAKAKGATGIHICGGTLRMMEIQKQKEATVLMGLGYSQLPSDFNPPDIMDDRIKTQIAEAISSMSATHHIDTSRCVVSIDGSFITLKKAPLEGKGKHLEEQVRWEMEQSLTSGVEDYIIDFYDAGADGFLVGVRTEVIDTYIDLCSKAGVKLKAADIDPFALFNLAEVITLFNEDKLGVVISVESKVANFAAFKGVSPVAAGIIDMKGKNGEDHTEPENFLARRIKRAVTSSYIDDEEGQPQRPHIDEVALGGDKGREDRLIQAVEAHLGVTPQILDPFGGLDVSSLPEDDQYLLDRGDVFCICAGLAYRGLQEK